MLMETRGPGTRPRLFLSGSWPASPQPDRQPPPTRGTPARVKVTSGLSFALLPPKAWATDQSIPVWWKSGWRGVLRKMESLHGQGEVFSEVKSP